MKSLEKQLELDWQHRPGMGKHMSLKAPAPSKTERKPAQKAKPKSWLPCLGGLAIAGGSAYAVVQGGTSRQVLGTLGIGAGAYLCWRSR